MQDKDIDGPMGNIGRRTLDLVRLSKFGTYSGRRRLLRRSRGTI